MRMTQMIKNNAYGYENQIKNLLLKSMLNMDKRQVDAWMKNQFDPSSMFIHVDDDIVTSCLQLKRNVFNYQKQKCSISSFSLACTLPDYRQRGYFSELLDAAINQSANNDLLSMVYTTFPKLYESRSFSSVSKTHSYWISSKDCNRGNDRNIHSYNESMDLYPIYEAFISHFDGSIILSKKQFNQMLQYNLDCDKKIAVVMQDGIITGFAIYKVVSLNVQMDYLIYLNSKAILDIFKYFGMRYISITFTISEYERFDKILNVNFPRINGTVMARCNNYKLFSKWCNHDIRNATQIFDSLDIPSWNQFM